MCQVHMPGCTHAACSPFPAQKEALSKRELELFLGEVSLLSRLHHRNIVQASGLATGQASLGPQGRACC